MMEIHFLDQMAPPFPARRLANPHIPIGKKRPQPARFEGAPVFIGVRGEKGRVEGGGEVVDGGCVGHVELGGAVAGQFAEFREVV